ncbi:MAG TPA: hypothetical protein VNR39_10925 [Pseudolabrys sp.]|nr:hypothetical protein [Pseudolabrys sp.]
MHGTPTDHQVKTWFELVRLLKIALTRKTRKTILYGDLAEAIFGARNLGAQSFANPLGEIHFRTKAYNRRTHSHHPSLNALVFNLKGEQPGIPEKQNPKKIWKILESEGPNYLDRLGVFLGYEDSKTKNLRRKRPSPTEDHGPTGGGIRSSALWEARHNPLAKSISETLRRDFKYIPCDGLPWKPDILLRSSTTGKILLVEVKPNSSSHNIITAVGQTLCYRSKFEIVTSIIAAPGIARIGAHLRDVLEVHAIKTLDLNGNVRKQLTHLSK